MGQKRVNLSDCVPHDYTIDDDSLDESSIMCNDINITSDDED